MNMTTAANNVSTGQSSVQATVRTNSGTIGPGITIQIERKNASNANANGIKPISYGRRTRSCPRDVCCQHRKVGSFNVHDGDMTAVPQLIRLEGDLSTVRRP